MSERKYKFFNPKTDEYADVQTLEDMVMFIINQFTKQERKETFHAFETSWNDEDIIDFIEGQGYSVDRVGGLIMEEEDKYKAGTKWGEGISSKRDDDKLIQCQKDSIGLLIQTRMKEEKLSLRKMEKLTNINLPQIHNIIHGKGNYGIETLLRVLNALDIKIFDKI